MAAAVEIENLSFSYKSHRILHAINMEIQTAKLTAILGCNGSGKSTLLRIMAGLLDYREGSVRIIGRELNGLAYGERARAVGFLSQQHRAVFPFSVLDVVLTGRAGYITLKPDTRDVGHALNAMKQVGIWDLQSHPYTELSGGEQQMVLIARVLAQRPRIILMDEPTSHLDLLNQSTVLRLARELIKEGTTVVCVLHDPNLAFSYADNLLFLREGQLVSPTSGVEPWSADFLNSVYGMDIKVIPCGERAMITPAIWQARTE